MEKQNKNKLNKYKPWTTICSLVIHRSDQTKKVDDGKLKQQQQQQQQQQNSVRKRKEKKKNKQNSKLLLFKNKQINE